MTLGISVPDVIAIVTLFSGLLLAFFNAKKGEADRKSNPPDPPAALIGGALVDTSWVRRATDAIEAQTAATVDQTAAIREYTAWARDREKDRTSDMLEQIIDKLEDKTPRRA
jgi:hypothetical protein